MILAKSVGNRARDRDFLPTGAANTGVADTVQKIGDKYVTRNNLSKIGDLALQVSEAGSKTCNVKIAQKIVQAPMLHCINANRPV